MIKPDLGQYKSRSGLIRIMTNTWMRIMTNPDQQKGLISETEREKQTKFWDSQRKNMYLPENFQFWSCDLEKIQIRRFLLKKYTSCKRFELEGNGQHICKEKKCWCYLLLITPQKYSSFGCYHQTFIFKMFNCKEWEFQPFQIHMLRYFFEIILTVVPDATIIDAT